MLSILALATQCATAAPAPIVAAVVMAETNGVVYSLQIDSKHTVSSDFDDAVQNVALGLLDGSTVKIGIAAVPTQEFDKRDISYSEGFSACRNMEIAGEILREAWERFGGQDEHWRLAALEIATGNPGVEGEFSEKFDLALTEARKVIQNNPHFLQNSPVKSDGRTQDAATPNVKNPSSSETTNKARSPNIYDRAPSNPLLIFSK